MADANVEALAKLLAQAPPGTVYGLDDGSPSMAEWLAQHGVRVVTDDWVNLSEPGEGPYRIEPEGNEYEVCWPEPTEHGAYVAPDEFMIGTHSKETATAICAFMNRWARAEEAT